MTMINVVVSTPVDVPEANISIEDIVSLLLESGRVDDIDFERYCRIVNVVEPDITVDVVNRIKKVNHQWLTDIFRIAPYLRESYFLLYSVDVRSCYTILTLEFVDDE